MMRCFLVLAAVVVQSDSLPSSFEDDECTDSGESNGGLELLQRQSRKLSEENQEGWGGSCASYGCRHGYHSWMKCQCNAGCEHYGNCCGDFQSKCVKDSQSGGSCAQYGCGGSYVASHSCQCTEQCAQYGNCCSDFGATCSKEPETTQTWTTTGGWSPPSTPMPSTYRLTWKAQGRDFFNQFNFLWDDPNHGSAQYLVPPQAEEEGVVEATSNWAIIRAGRRSPQYKYKRMTARVESKASWKNFLSIFKFSHVPYGCGVWPALFTLANQGEWPNGGELDMLEYVNMDVSKASFHTGGSCTLDSSAVNQYGSMPDRNRMDYDCVTNYPDRLGCAPNKWMKSAQSWAHSPGVLATQWTDKFIKLFYIPEHEIPQDIKDEAPHPEDWNRWLFSYFPLSDSCYVAAQKLMMQINFCGDWAGKVWSADGSCNQKVHNCRAVDPLKEYAPQEDCCTKFIWDPHNEYGTDQYLRERAYFNISYIKIFQ